MAETGGAHGFRHERRTSADGRPDRAASGRSRGMRVRTHLISMPWAQPDAPSIQLACLKAHLDRVQGRRSDCRVYSAFFSILHDFRGSARGGVSQDVSVYNEYVYLPLYLSRFGPAEHRSQPGVARLLEAIRAPGVKPLSLSVLKRLERSTRRYLDRQVVPNLIDRGLNLVGFTLNYDQVYASLYAAEHLRQCCPGRNLLFVYGGNSASLPTVYNLLTKLGVPGVVVVGEGEKKLELLVRTFQERPPAEGRTALAAAAGLDAGIVVIGSKVDFGTRDPAHYAMQAKSLDELPLPDFDEYFAALRSVSASEEAFAAVRETTDVLVEGSRGCFGRCNFCAMHRSWDGFRKRSPGHVVRDTLAVTRRYRTSRVQFLDNVCDSWAADYARTLVRQGIRQQSVMELRATHPEHFWTLLALAGVRGIQVGVEALSSALLQGMGKGTRAVQNLAAHKVLTELGISSGSNLITEHPASTLADVDETRRIVGQIPHWGPFRLTTFRLMAGSPLYEGLSAQERAALKPEYSFRLPGAAARYALEYSFEAPERLRLGREVRRAWVSFKRDYERERARHAIRQPRLDLERVGPDRLRITDSRDGKMSHHDVSGAAARVYDACHGGSKLDGIARATGCTPESVGAELERFLQARVMLQVDDEYLSLATRPRDELLRRYFASHGEALHLPDAPAERLDFGKGHPRCAGRAAAGVRPAAVPF
jgi:radical SAM superfamily enzyme YgiQ (UPF0313 family)